MKCAGNSTETCGGDNAIEVFRIRNVATENDSDSENVSASR